MLLLTSFWLKKYFALTDCYLVRAMCGIANSAGALLFDSAASSAVEPHIFEISARALHNVATWFR